MITNIHQPSSPRSRLKHPHLRQNSSWGCSNGTKMKPGWTWHPMFRLTVKTREKNMFPNRPLPLKTHFPKQTPLWNPTQRKNKHHLASYGLFPIGVKCCCTSSNPYRATDDRRCWPAYKHNVNHSIFTGCVSLLTESVCICVYNMSYKNNIIYNIYIYIHTKQKCNKS